MSKRSVSERRLSRRVAVFTIDGRRMSGDDFQLLDRDVATLLSPLVFCLQRCYDFLSYYHLEVRVSIESHLPVLSWCIEDWATIPAAIRSRLQAEFNAFPELTRAQRQAASPEC